MIQQPIQMDAHPSVVAIEYTIPGGLDWEERGEQPPLSIKHGDQVCLIMSNEQNVLQLKQSDRNENTHVVTRTTSRIRLPEDFNAKFCFFTEIADTLFVFVMADNMQTCAVYNFLTHECAGYGIIPDPLPANCQPSSVDIVSESDMQLTYFIAGEHVTVNIHM